MNFIYDNIFLFLKSFLKCFLLSNLLSLELLKFLLSLINLLNRSLITEWRLSLLNGLSLWIGLLIHLLSLDELSLGNSLLNILWLLLDEWACLRLLLDILRCLWLVLSLLRLIHLLNNWLLSDLLNLLLRLLNLILWLNLLSLWNGIILSLLLNWLRICLLRFHNLRLNILWLW